LLQIWIMPNARGLTPGYEQKMFSDESKAGKLALIASHKGREGSVTINQDADVYASIIDAGQSVTHTTGGDRKVWLQVARGSVRVNGVDLQQGDGAALTDETTVTVEGKDPAEILLFDMS
jgi:redox-sensitive bicupin YhaK (pirin superfamily)